MTSTSRLEVERDLYRHLLDAAAADDPHDFLNQVCRLLHTSTASTSTFLGVFAGTSPCWTTAVDMEGDHRSTVVQSISQGVLMEALRTGEVVHTSSALVDPRFQARESVRRNSIEAVMCVPIPIDETRQAVVYLQREAGGGPFDEHVVALVHHIGAHIANVGFRALRPTDATSSARTQLRCCDLVGRSAALGHLLDQVAIAAPLDLDVLLTGESGTGKSVIARLIHDNSSRSTGPFVHINCPSVSETLFEAEMFGVKAGAYTGASTHRDGFIEHARRGTLFLDEVGELNSSMQAKLLQVLQERTYSRVGDPVSRRADIRVVAATNIDLEEAVREGTFRADLRYRLEVMPMRVPSIHQRRGDIRGISEFVLDRIATRHTRLGRLSLSAGAHLALTCADWPGNIRQLAHVLEAAAVRAHAQGHQVIDTRHLFPESSREHPTTWHAATREFQRELLRSSLAASEGNLTAAARSLELSRSRAYELARQFGLRATIG